MKCSINIKRKLGRRNEMIYGHFIEHFHRQIYGGVYDPGNPLSDEDGLRKDVLEAMRGIKVPVLRWPGGCFVSSYNWKKAVGPKRTPFFDKAWRVEDPNTFGTDEYVKMCRKIGCEPYICTNAGTGTAEEMSDWVEYCNLETEGEFAKWRIENGNPEPFFVKYWSIGNENYGGWEIGAKSAEEWGRLVLEAAKMIKHVDPTTELTAAALADLDWNINLLKHCGNRLDWISIHKYWDMIHETNACAGYEQVMAYTNDLETDINKVRGLLTAMGLEKQIKIAYDEWNLRGWYHPNAHTVKQGIRKEDYLYPRDKNDDNSLYTMADAVFSACFLNTCNRNCDLVGMANFAPIVNTRGCIYTHKEGIVLRSTYHVFDLYVNYLGEQVLDVWKEDPEQITVTDRLGEKTEIDELDVVATYRETEKVVAIAAVNKNAEAARYMELSIQGGFSGREYRICSVNGENVDSYNDIGSEQVKLVIGDWKPVPADAAFELAPHSVNVIQIK